MYGRKYADKNGRLRVGVYVPEGFIVFTLMRRLMPGWRNMREYP
jgi:hypothetical protein